MEYTENNFDDAGVLVDGKVPTITTELSEIGSHDGSIYFVVIIKSNDYCNLLFDTLKNFSNVQWYGFKDFKTNLYPKSNFDYAIFEKKIKEDKYLQIQFNFEISDVDLKKLLKEYFKIKDIFLKVDVPVINQITNNLAK